MDTVRFGRVLGQGARHAAKTLVSAVDAATAPNPSPSVSSPPVSARPAPPTSARTPEPPRQTILPPSPPSRPPAAASTRPPVATTGRGLAEGSRRFGRAVWAPAVRLSGVLWLELTGVFFGLFALIAGIAAWRLRFALSAAPPSEDRTRLLFAAGMVLVFGYFSSTSFLKAHRRSRRS